MDTQLQPRHEMISSVPILNLQQKQRERIKRKREREYILSSDQLYNLLILAIRILPIITTSFTAHNLSTYFIS